MNDNKARYDFYRLCRVRLDSPEHVELFQDIEAKSDSYTFYGHARTVGQSLTIMVAASKIAEFSDILDRFKVSGEILEHNMQAIMDAEAMTIKPKDTPPSEFDWDHYFHLSTIYAWLDLQASKFPSTVSVFEIGKSYEGVPIKALKISNNPSGPTVLVEGTIHAREWISPAVCTYILNAFLASSKDPNKMADVSALNWIFLPIVNPDGYICTFEQDRLWRKNRKPYGRHRGVDLNRNFDCNWAGDGATSDPAGYDFAGSEAFSESEARVIRDFVVANREKEDIRAYIALHSYSQLIMFPFGHTAEPVKNAEDLRTICGKAAEAIRGVHGMEYKFGSKNETIYPSSGGSIDWAYTKNVPVSITFELRGPPDSKDMFILPAKEIRATGEEILEAFLAIVKETKRMGYFD